MKTTNNLVFVHLLKCGGTAFWQAIIQHYKIGDGDYSRTFSMSGKNQIDRFNNVKDKQKIEFFYGHLHDEITLNNISLLLEQTKNNKYHFITVTREPIDRIISTYYYLRLPKCMNHPLHNIVTNYKLKDIYKKGFIREIKNKEKVVAMYNYFFNYQTRIFSGKEVLVNRFKKEPKLIHLDSEHDISCAKLNLLNMFHYIGFQPTIDNDWNFLCSRFGIKYPDEYFFRKENRPNITEKKPSISEIDKDTIKLIIENNQADIQLYNWILKRGAQVVNRRTL